MTREPKPIQFFLGQKCPFWAEKVNRDGTRMVTCRRTGYSDLKDPTTSVMRIQCPKNIQAATDAACRLTTTEPPLGVRGSFEQEIAAQQNADNNKIG